MCSLRPDNFVSLVWWDGQEGLKVPASHCSHCVQDHVVADAAVLLLPEAAEAIELSAQTGHKVGNSGVRWGDSEDDGWDNALAACYITDSPVEAVVVVQEGDFVAWKN
ncbi:unnamed protein product [Bursaphelenchus xylophilus]|uniref:(pine wood nematode) hypothetical protein n=1 Tax=Bursaphelenchus xylophilus TaxID=6326 RepID=A0A811JXD6_BURXY|nr:unnamed protein product [Bursaphelenchus xylophilus]CAG9079469.1 unnamed protein product [Bursaphelenchus xylophilus]